MGQTLYAIKDDFSVDSLCLLDFGKFAFKPEDFRADYVGGRDMDVFAVVGGEERS